MAHDPFLLLPSFFLGLPVPQSRLVPEDGMLSLRDGGLTYVLVGADLAGDPYSLKFQEKFDALVSGTIAEMKAKTPDLTVLRTGAVFYAGESAKEATDETSIIGLASTIGTLALILLVFRGIRPIVMGFAAIAVGVLFAFVGTLLIFGQIHAVALLFGVSLIGISVDYSLQYFCEYFDADAKGPQSRLARVLPGVMVGPAATDADRLLHPVARALSRIAPGRGVLLDRPHGVIPDGAPLVSVARQRRTALARRILCRPRGAPLGFVGGAALLARAPRDRRGSASSRASSVSSS